MQNITRRSDVKDTLAINNIVHCDATEYASDI